MQEIVMEPGAPVFAKPSPSATVVLARDGAAGPEVLLVLRNARTSFGASYVFPGGLLETSDGSVADLCDGIDDAAASAILGLPSGGLAYYSAAIRELFEEAGVLLARTPDGAWADGARYAACRDDLNAGRLSWADFVARNDLRLGCDALHYFSFWITPREVPRRFTTRFFIAALPAGQVATHCGGELTDSRWMSPQSALEASRAGDIAMPQPTIVTLRSIREFGSVPALLEWGCQCTDHGVPCVLPAIVSVDGREKVVMPGCPDYPDYPGDES